jgi:hypothetical protein
MVLCKQCIFWKPGPTASMGGDRFGECSNPNFKLGYFEYDETREFSDDVVIVEDDEGWGFSPGPDFGCIHGREPGGLDV